MIIQGYQKKILSLYPELKKLNSRINLIPSYRQAGQISVMNHKLKIEQINQELGSQREVTNQYWGSHMREQNLLYRFYNLFHLTNKHNEQQRKK